MCFQSLLSHVETVQACMTILMQRLDAILVPKSLSCNAYFMPVDHKVMSRDPLTVAEGFPEGPEQKGESFIFTIIPS